MTKLVFDEEKLNEVIDRIVKRTFEMDFEWDWPGGVAFYGVAEAYEATENDEYLELLKNWTDEKLEDGLPKLSINGVSIGHTLLSLYQATGDDRYLDTARQMADYVLHEAPRFADGVLQHTVNSEKHVFPEQAWVDTMMMAGLFLLRIGKLVGSEEYFEDGLRQYHGHEEFLQDMETNLYYHGWDHVAKNNLSGIFWGRGNGWAALTMAKALPLIDVTHPSYMIIDGSLRDLLSALVRLQHPSGLWHTVLTDPDSYLEVSGSAGIASSLLSRGSLYHKSVQKALSAITDAVAPDGRVERVSAGTAVMRDAQGYKDVPYKRIQGWGQGLALTFLADVVRSKSRAFQ
ncbi:glycoside hydrolase family 105 protein [Bacillus haynesii]|uniref:glycoside hydrolase family 88/105 protein n=1 Tax=Bacillus haynesii TaxID=1925021 RepID=UPI0012B974D9|nr:glycoside hydrolase family 105 protein [Bacillus haynesii]TWK28668.1 Unsaturated rhamnogalacturonyl hydrolase YesR [Bacillus licheniformis]MCY7836565.1 glycoside hydrolase family 105 protein [Bacillus haynesii]MCY7845253.1 glycoside hydrolase family 105 protein [Bacillus haynesii]MCY7966520.1 glycoside hydrolase family 105 protein [Bacillus haynesii]MCY7990163.1 glycoside hydrolase family 105 protein [Bacillus haynesii]